MWQEGGLKLLARPLFAVGSKSKRCGDRQLMADQFIVQYVGFTAGALARDYSFVVRDESRQSREYTVTIANEAFVSHRVRYQDGPNICSLRLHRELAAAGDNPIEAQFCVTDSELTDYQNDHKAKSVKRFQARKLED